MGLLNNAERITSALFESLFNIAKESESINYFLFVALSRTAASTKKEIVAGSGIVTP